MSASATAPVVEIFFHKGTFTCTFVVHDPDTKKCAIIDSVMDYNPASGRTSSEHNDLVIEYVKKNELEPEWIIESHVHADHLTGAAGLKEAFPGAKTAIGEHVTTVQATFAKLFNLPELKTDGSQFDHLFKDGETFALGSLTCRVLHTPGHTPADVTIVVNDSAGHAKYAFCGDSIFAPDFGSARCDFPAGSAEQLFDSIQKLYELPDDCVTMVGHDYQPGGRDLEWAFTIKEQKEKNKHVNTSTTKEEFVEWRQGRDKTLGAPRLILPALQVNLRNGHLPEPEDNGTVYLKIPVNVIG